MGWAARLNTRVGQRSTKPELSRAATHHGSFKPGQAVTIAGVAYTVDDNGSIRRVGARARRRARRQLSTFQKIANLVKRCAA